MTSGRFVRALGALILVYAATPAVLAGQQAPTNPATAPAPVANGTAASADAPQDYVIGPDDVLGVLFWRDEAMSSDVIVRPDGKISLPLLNDVQAAGQTPEGLRSHITELAKQFISEPSVSIVVRQLNSRKVFITGQVTRPGSYTISTPTSILQLIALAGGLAEYAQRESITLIRPGQAQPLRFNYDEVSKGKKIEQNVILKVGDTIIVP